MTFLGRLFGRRDDDSNELPSMPWDQHPSILEHIRSHIAAGEPGMTEGGYTLPDEERVNQGSRIRWAAGAKDGVTMLHMGAEHNEDAIRRTVELALAYSRQPTAKNKAAIYNHVLTEQLVSIIDPVVEALANAVGINHDRLYELARSLVTEAPDREPVKFGIAILGLFRQPADRELFQTLGRHDEFTLFCAVAIANESEDHDEALWSLARNVTGWGRIHVVEQLAQTTNPAIKRWLLREGFRNAVMYEYLAGTCARAGGLLAALSEDRVDPELLHAAGDIIHALITGGPADGIDDYEDALPAIDAYLGHMETSAKTVEDFLHVSSIKGYLNDDARWARRSDAEATAERRDGLRSQCDWILGRPEWPDRVRAALDKGDDLAVDHASRAAKSLDIDTWEIHWQRLRQMPVDPSRWFFVMDLCNEERIDKVIKFAEANLDLLQIATGAANELGLGRAFAQHLCLDYVLQELGRFPGWGERLVGAALKSPVVRNRNMAVRTLVSWPRTTWTSGLVRSLEEAAACEPNEQVRNRMQEALRRRNEA